MQKRTFVLKDPEGIHARNAARVVMAVKEAGASVKLLYGGGEASGDDILGLMALNVRCGGEVTVMTEDDGEMKILEKVEQALNGSRT